MIHTANRTHEGHAQWTLHDKVYSLVNRHDRDVLARLTVVNRSLETVNHNIGELLWQAVQRQDTGGLNASDLRVVGHRLVSLAGDLTTLGVDMARWADELDEVIDTDG